MNLLLAVIDDLARFALYSIRKAGMRMKHAYSVGGGRASELHDTSSVIYASPRTERLLISSAPVVEKESNSHDASYAPEAIHLERNTVVYVSTADAPLRNSPTRGVDNILERMQYGSMLVTMGADGGWVHAFYRGIEGYCEIRDLADRAAHVYPKFVIGEGNASDDPNTERVRAIISDEFCYGESDVPLQAEEYVLYKLIRNGVMVPWNKERPRKPGFWASLLRDAKGVERLIEPLPRTIMEWVMPNGSGHIAFVESVQSDGTLTLSEANWPENGTYNERVLMREEWMQLAPTFMKFI